MPIFGRRHCGCYNTQNWLGLIDEVVLCPHHALIHDANEVAYKIKYEQNLQDEYERALKFLRG